MFGQGNWERKVTWVAGSDREVALRWENIDHDASCLSFTGMRRGAK